MELPGVVLPQIRTQQRDCTDLALEVRPRGVKQVYRKRRRLWDRGRVAIKRKGLGVPSVGIGLL
jgi:hypothetical protein